MTPLRLVRGLDSSEATASIKKVEGFPQSTWLRLDRHGSVVDTVTAPPYGITPSMTGVPLGIAKDQMEILLATDTPST
jgi:hypothetical protein